MFDGMEIDKTKVFNDLFTGAGPAFANADGSLERITPDKLYDFHTGEDGHVFDVEYDEDMKELEAKIDEAGGILEPLIVRPDAEHEGCYEVISGHRRKYIGMMKGYPEFLCVVRDYDDADAIKLMVSTNLDKRKKLKKSTLAKAYKAYMDANKMQGKQRSATCVQNEHKLKTRELAAEEFGVSASKVQRTIRLCYLIKPLQDLVDSGRLAENIAIELSYCPEEVQDGVDKVLKGRDKVWCSLPAAQTLRNEFAPGTGRIYRNAFDDVLPIMRENYSSKPHAVKPREVEALFPEDIRAKSSDGKLKYLKMAISFYEEHDRGKAVKN